MAYDRKNPKAEEIIDPNRSWLVAADIGYGANLKVPVL